MIKRIATGVALSLGATLGLSLAAAPAQALELKLSHFLPSTHPTQTVFIEPWIADLKACAGDDVNVTIFPAGSAFGHVAKQLDQVRAGVVDIAHGLTGIPRGRLPRTTIIDMPFLTKSADSASKTLWGLYESGTLKPEYKGLKVLALHAHNPGKIHTRDKPVNSIEDLKGLRIRFPSLAISMMLKHLGASPVGLPPTQVYENLQKGVIDGTVFPWEAVNGFKLYEVLNHHLDASVYTTSFYFVMNQRKFDSLPGKVKGCIDSLSGQTLVNKFGPWWDAWDKPGLEAVLKKGNTVTAVDDATRAQWLAALKPMVDEYLAALKEQGVADPAALYAEAQALVAKFEH
ncbi:MAG: TRAP transporter substrate-binding protein [Rhodobacterales bacterium]|nr:TRAP transporter substrate-binding protein [Rhodobacterales bacterium]